MFLSVKKQQEVVSRATVYTYSPYGLKVGRVDETDKVAHDGPDVCRRGMLCEDKCKKICAKNPGMVCKLTHLTDTLRAALGIRADGSPDICPYWAIDGHCVYASKPGGCLYHHLPEAKGALRQVAPTETVEEDSDAHSDSASIGYSSEDSQNEPLVDKLTGRTK